MNTTLVQDRPTMRSREAWPRLTDWIDAFIPADFVRRGGFTHNIRIEELSRDGTYLVRAELPGLDPDKDVDVCFQNGLLTIEATREEHEETDEHSEFYYGRFVRVIPIPDAVDPDSAQASYENGILEIRMDVMDQGEGATQIPIKKVS